MIECKSGDLKLDAAVNSWLKLDKNAVTRQEVIDDISNSRWDKLRSTMLHRQKFGTAGLRGRMSAGYNCMNDVVVLQTAQGTTLYTQSNITLYGMNIRCYLNPRDYIDSLITTASQKLGVLNKGLCSYLRKVCSQEQLHNGVVVGFDGRHNSRRFAELTAKVFTSSSIPVHIFSAVCPTPFVSFATILYHAAAGVMVTASHNPKEDNGYKVYWGNGSMIIAPHDDNLLDEILQCLDIPDDHWNIGEIRSHELVKDCQDEVTKKYMEYVQGTLSEEVLGVNKTAAIDIVYSAMHGVGYDYVLKAFEASNLKAPISVPQQQYPNPDFPTVHFPNPEELECLELSKKLAEQRDVKLVLVNDPDADRLAVAEYNKSCKTWKVFTGNEMGALLGWSLLKQYEATGPKDSEIYMIASVVSSKMLRAILKGKGEFVETLTGFKWMGNTTLLLAQQGKLPLLAFEEAIGYMCNHRVPDKDGVSAAVQVASLASHLYSQNSSLVEQLDSLYAQYGYHVSHNSYYICHEPTTIQKIFRRIRNYHGPGQYPKKVGACEIVYLNDLAAGIRVPEERVNGGGHLNVLGTGLDQDYTSGEMVMFRCSNGLSATIRTSGTEPKLKYYSELVCHAKDQGEQEKAKQKVKEVVKAFIDELVQPKENGLVG